MSLEQMLDVWDSDVEGATQQILLVLANAANEDGENVYPSQIFVAWRTGLELPTVKAVYRKLREQGVLVLVRRGSRRPGERQTNEYRLNMAKTTPKVSLEEWCRQRGFEPSRWMVEHEARRQSRRQARRRKSGISDIPESGGENFESGISGGGSGISGTHPSGISNIPNTKGGETKAPKGEGGTSGARAPRRGGEPLPPNFALTSEMREWARVNVPSLRPAQIERETLIFVSMQRSKNAVSHDWVAAWQVWILRKAGWEEGKPTDQRQLPLDGSNAAKPDPGCTKCFGTGMWYPQGKEKGVARCDCYRKSDEGAGKGGAS